MNTELNHSPGYIDHVFLLKNNLISVDSYRIVSTKYGDSYASDHNAVQADFTIDSEVTDLDEVAPTEKPVAISESSVGVPNTGSEQLSLKKFPLYVTGVAVLSIGALLIRLFAGK